MTGIETNIVQKERNEIVQGPGGTNLLQGGTIVDDPAQGLRDVLDQGLEVLDTHTEVGVIGIDLLRGVQAVVGQGRWIERNVRME